MTRKFAYLVLATAFLAPIGPANSQTAPSGNGVAGAPTKEQKLPTAEELSNRAAQASGGKEAWQKIDTMVMTGTVDVPTYNVSGTTEIRAKRPNMVLRVSNMMGGQFIQKQGFDGKIAWTSDPQSGLKSLTGAALEQQKVEAIFDQAAHLKEVYPDMTVTGQTKVGDRDAYTAVAHEPGNKTVTFYFDAQTGHRIAEDTEGPNENGTLVKTNMFFDDYRAEGNVQMAHKIRINAPQVNVEIKIETVKINVPVDDAMFAMPAAN